MLILEDLTKYPVRLREALSAGEPLNPEVIEKVKAAWGVTIRDGYGQTETTAQVGNSPGQPLKPGSMGRPLPGLPDRAARRGGAPGGRGGGDLHLARAAAHRAHGRLRGRRQPQRLRDAPRPLPHRRRRHPRRRRLHHLRRPRRRRLQELRLPHLPLRAGERPHRARGGGRGGRRARAPTRCAALVPKAFIILKPGQAPARELALRHLPLPAAPARALQAGAAAGVLRPAQDHLRQDPPRRAAQARTERGPSGRARGARVLAGRLPGAQARLTGAVRSVL